MIDVKFRQIIINKGQSIIMLENPAVDNSIVSITETGRCVYAADKMIDEIMLTEQITKKEAIDMILKISHENPIEDITKPMIINTYKVAKIKEDLEQSSSAV